MTLHLLKLCVGVESIAELRAFTRMRRQRAPQVDAHEVHAHVTRMIPKRVDELLDGGSLYWVIKGEVAARQRLLELRTVVDPDGVRRCGLVLDPAVIRVEPRPSRPFQGWRYLADREAPRDLGASTGTADLPEALSRELRDLGLL